MKPPPTLPDLLRDGLAVVFVGINPSLYSVAQGHYFCAPREPVLAVLLALGAERPRAARARGRGLDARA
jgi:G:T/U-mismatch repair DNA glycosylase